MSPKPNHIAIIGAGLAGCSLALELEKRSWAPLLVHDDKRLSSSDVAAGLINPIVPKGVRMTWNWEKMFPGWMDYYRHWEAYLGSSFAETLPLHQLHRHPDHEREWNKQASKGVYPNFIRPLSDDLPVSSTAQSGHSVMQSGRLNVQDFCKATRQHFKDKGCLVEARFEADPSNPAFVSVNGQEVQNLVYCQGIEMMDDPVWNWLPMHPTGGDILRVQLPDGILANRAIWKSKEWLVPIQNSPNEWLMGSNFHKGNRSQSPEAQDAEDLLNRVSEWLGIRPVLLDHKRAVRPTVGSRRPYLGRHPVHEHLYVFNGLGSKGSALVTWLAPVMADFISNRSELPEEVNITRYWDNDIGLV